MKAHSISQRGPAWVITTITGVIVAIITGSIAYGVAKYQAEKQAAIALSFSAQKFNARLDEYSKLWNIIMPISSRSICKLKQKDMNRISENLNHWFYSRGGLVAHEYTRSLVWQLRNATARWVPKGAGECNKKTLENFNKKMIYDLKNTIIYSTRNDLNIVARKDVDVHTLYDLIKKRDDNIKAILKKANVLN